MRRFALLQQELQAASAPAARLEALRRYFALAPPADAAWAVQLLCGATPGRVVPVAVLREAACRQAGIDDWLFDTCRRAAGDVLEALALVLPELASPPADGADPIGLAAWIETRLLPLRGLTPAEQKARLAAAWGGLDAPGRLLCIRLLAGRFRVDVSRGQVLHALADHAGLPVVLLAQRMEAWAAAPGLPDADRLRSLLAPVERSAEARGQPLPFALRSDWRGPPASQGDVADWLAEWAYDGLRAQVVRADGQVWIWTSDGELATDRFPEVAGWAAAWPEGTVLDGELLAWRAGEPRPGPHGGLEKRLGRGAVTRRLLDGWPAAFIARDLLMAAGNDRRALPHRARRQLLAQALADGPFVVPPLLEAVDWPALDALRSQSRRHGAAGLLLRHGASSPVDHGPDGRAGWWMWRADPLTVDALLLYAQEERGGRSAAGTECTFAVWNREPRDEGEVRAVIEAVQRREPPLPGALQLLPVARAVVGPADPWHEFVGAEVRTHTQAKFGPVRHLRPRLVFEIAFDGVQPSARHRIGYTLGRPRVLCLRRDKAPWQAGSLTLLQALTDPS